jgi:pimeloyl-ACP methyl ester carboxylesterase
MTGADSIWSVTTGAAVSPGRSPIDIRSGWLRSRYCPGRTRTPYRALQMPDGEQAQRSRHHKAFLEPDAADVVLADNASWLRERLTAAGVSAAAIEEHLSVIGNKPAMEAALTWYRARGAIRGPLGMIRVPTLYIWGDADDTVGRVAAEGTREFVSATYRFEVLPGIAHFAAEQTPERVSELLLEHVAAHPI